jgi:DNA mismatch repair protein MSH5
MSTSSVVNNSVQDTSEMHQQEVDDAEADTLSEVVMAVDMRERGTVGCAYYIASEEKLFFMEDVKLGGVEAVDSCWRPPQPPVQP